MADTNSNDVTQALAAEKAANPALMAVIDLEDGFISMGSVFEAFDELAGDQTPAWLSVVRSEFDRLQLVMERVSSAVRPGVAQ